MRKLKLNGEYTEAELLQLIQESKTPKEWYEKLKKGNFQLEITEHGRLYGCLANEDINKIYSFETQQEADLTAKQINLFIEMKAFAKLRNDGWVADWNDDTKIKFGILEGNNIVCDTEFWNCINFVYGISVKSKKIAEEMLSVFRQRILEVYGK
jgi:hypothetical protein